MYLILNIFGFKFSLPVDVVDRVFDLCDLEAIDDELYLDHKKVFCIDSADFFKIEKSFTNMLEYGVLLNIVAESPIVLKVSKIPFFVNKNNIKNYMKHDIFNQYGFNFVSGFAIFRSEMLFMTDKDSLEKRASELVWES